MTGAGRGQACLLPLPSHKVLSSWKRRPHEPLVATVVRQQRVEGGLAGPAASCQRPENPSGTSVLSESKEVAQWGRGALPHIRPRRAQSLLVSPYPTSFTDGETVAWEGATSRNKSAAQLGLEPRCPDSWFEALSTTPASLQQPPSSSLLPPRQSGPRLPPPLGTFQPILGAHRPPRPPPFLCCGLSRPMLS